MGHKDFDDRIRKKLSGLSPKFNPDQWDDMVDMLRFSTLRPWYVRWEKALWGSGLLLFSLLNFYLLWQVRSEKGAREDLNATLQEKVVVIDTIEVVDTVFVTKTIYSDNSVDPAAIHSHKAKVAKTYSYPRSLSVSSGKKSPLNPSPANLRAAYLSFPAYNPYPANNQSFLIYNQSFFDDNRSLSDDNKGAGTQTEAVPFIVAETTDPEKWLEDYADGFKVQGVVLTGEKPRRKYRAHPFEARVGLTAGLLIPNPDIGERYISQSLGLIGEFSLKRNLRFITGVHFNDITYKLDEVDNDNFDAVDLARYPGYTELTTIPDEIIIENEIIQLPLHLRLYKNLNYNWSVFISGGPTIDFLLNQSFKYKYIEIENDQLIEFNEVTWEKDLRIYLGNFTGSVGIEHNFSRKLAGQMNVNYQYGLSRLGVERRSVHALSLNLAAFYKLN